MWWPLLWGAVGGGAVLLGRCGRDLPHRLLPGDRGGDGFRRRNADPRVGLLADPGGFPQGRHGVGHRKGGKSTRYILLLWVSVTVAAALASLVGYVALGQAPGVVIGGVEAFAAGAIITMLADTMMPEAYEKGGPTIGVVTAVGFIVSFLLSRA